MNDLLIICGIIGLVILGLVLSLCMVSSNSEDDRKDEEDEDQIKYIDDYFKRKGSKK